MALVEVKKAPNVDLDSIVRIVRDDSACLIRAEYLVDNLVGIKLPIKNSDILELVLDNFTAII